MAGATNRVEVMQLLQGSMRHWCATATAAQNQKPGAEVRPGSILQFQFPE
jgi:hypothetical protein